jgi:hypothetical protein
MPPCYSRKKVARNRITFYECMIVLKKDINASNYITAVKSNKEKKLACITTIHNTNFLEKHEPQYLVFMYKELDISKLA